MWNIASPKDQDKFYKIIIERHEKELENEGCNQNDGK